MGHGKKAKGKPSARMPKKKCCESKVRCDRCPLRMLKEGTLPDGYAVHKRRLVKVADAPVDGADPLKRTKAAGKKNKKNKKNKRAMKERNGSEGTSGGSDQKSRSVGSSRPRKAS